MNNKRIRKRYNKNTKIIIIMVLTIGVIGLSIGFSAFSKNLDINSTATVNPDPSNFKVLFSSSKYSVVQDKINCDWKNSTDIICDDATLEGTTIKGIKIHYTGDYKNANYMFYAYNDGEMDAYLKSITMGNIKCVPKSGNSNTLVTKACEKVNVAVAYDENNASDYIYAKITNTNIKNHVIKRKTAKMIRVYVFVDHGAADVDEDYDIVIGDIVLTFSSNDS